MVGPCGFVSPLLTLGAFLISNHLVAYILENLESPPVLTYLTCSIRNGGKSLPFAVVAKMTTA